MFASRDDLLKRSDAHRLAQLAVPSDRQILDDAALRLAITGGSLAAYSVDDRQTIALALAAIDIALADADALILSYGIPSDSPSTLLPRLATTIALYYLYGADRVTEDMQKAYGSCLFTLKSHAAGAINLGAPLTIATLGPVDDGVELTSSPSRYGGSAASSPAEDW